MTLHIDKLAAKVIDGKTLSEGECESLFFAGSGKLSEMMFYADGIRRHHKGNRVRLCSIINAKSGMCSEDCRFCAQSAHARSEVKAYPLVSSDTMISEYVRASDEGALCFGVVTSGRGLSDGEIVRIGEAVKRMRSQKAANPSRRFSRISASLGELSRGQIAYLKDCGLKKYHHNLETSEKYFPSVCTTHSYSDRIKTLRAVKAAGLELCCGGLFGIGESARDRFEFAMALRDISPSSVPLNFLNPVTGTDLENAPRLSPREILGIIAAFRFALPDKDISVCGGREVNLRDLQSWIFYAGANGMMTGGYLTTAGRSPDEDKRMLDDLGLEVSGE
jgi:biotin synthase